MCVCSLLRFTLADFTKPSMDRVLLAFCAVSGFHEFRPNQALPCLVFNTGRNVFAIVRTGGGKTQIIFTCVRLAADDYKLRPPVARAARRAIGVIVCPLQALVQQFLGVAEMGGLSACVVTGKGNTFAPDPHSSTHFRYI
jgi:replicative superfamily II helicase